MKAENEFPKTLQSAIKHFADPDVALNFMVSIRWPNGVKCPRCGSDKASFTAKRRVWTCECCPNRRQFSIKVGTIMEDSPITLDKWLVGMWLIVSAKNGISSYELHRALGITQKSAWFLGHRIRLALQHGTFEKMSGEIEADESYLGGKVRNMHADKTVNVIKKTPMADSDFALNDEFKKLVARWKDETFSISSLSKIYAHPAYQRIMAMGISGLPLVLKELQNNQGHWFYALKFMAGKNVAEGFDNFEDAKAAWLEWGYGNNYI